MTTPPPPPGTPFHDLPRALLAILCAFPGVFVAGGIVVDETGEATDTRTVELEEAGEVEF